MKIRKPIDQEAIKKSVGAAGEDVIREFPGLTPGQAVLSGDAMNTPALVQIRKRLTDHGAGSLSATKQWSETYDRQQSKPVRSIAVYANDLADAKERSLQEELEAKAEEANEDKTPDGWEWDEQLKDSNAPPRATLTTKTIDDRDYYYYQWREGNKIKSEYVAPVSPKSNWQS